MRHNLQKNIKKIFCPKQITPGVLLWTSYLITIFYFIVYQGLSTKMTSFKYRAIGEAISVGIDGSKRNRNFIIICGGFFFLFFILPLVFQRLDRLFRKILDASIYFGLRNILNTWGGFGFISLLFFGWRQQNIFTAFSLFSILICLISIVASLIFYKAAVTSKCSIRPELFEATFQFSLFIGFCIPFLRAFWNNGIVNFDAAAAIGIVSCVAILFWSLSFLQRFKKIAIINWNVCLCPWTLLPFLLLAAMEMQYAFRKHALASTTSISQFIFIGLCTLSLIIFLLIQKRQLTSFQFKIYNKFWFYPSLLFSIISVLHYTGQTNIGAAMDFLHFGNDVIPTQQLFQFGKLPFVDLWYAQGLMKLLFSTAYSLFHEYNLFEFLNWNFLSISVGFLVYYFFFILFLPPFIAFYGLLLLPIGDLTAFGGYYTMCLLPGIYLGACIKKPTFIRMSIFWILGLVAFAWMQSAGGIAILGSFGTILFLHFFDGSGKYKFKNTFGSALIVFSVSAFVFLLLRKLGGHSIGDTLSLINSFTLTDTLIGNYGSIWWGEWSALVPVQYFLLPGACLLLILGITLKWLQEFRMRIQYYSIIFLALVGLATFIRALHRHCLVEGLQFHFSVMVVTLSPLIFLRPFKRGVMISSFVMIAFLLFIPYPMKLVPAPLLREGVWLQLRDWSPTENRVTIDESFQKRAQKLKSFFDRMLTPDQTFFEFVSAHLLYALTQRPVPFFHHSAQILYSEIPQEIYVKEFGEMLSKNKIPLVVFRSPTWWGDHIDNIPTEMSGYKIAEFIYKNFQPIGLFDGFEIWGQNNQFEKLKSEFNAIKKELPTDTLLTETISQNFNYKKLAFIWGNIDNRNAKDLPILEIAHLKESLLHPGKEIEFEFLNHPQDDGLYLDFNLDYPDTEDCNVEFKYGPNLADSFLFDLINTTQLDQHHFILRASSQWRWHKLEKINGVLKAKSTCKNSIKINEIVLRAGD